MAKKRKAAGRDAPGASRPPAARLKATATVTDDEEVSRDTSLLGGGARGSDVVERWATPISPQRQRTDQVAVAVTAIRRSVRGGAAAATAAQVQPPPHADQAAPAAAAPQASQSQSLPSADQSARGQCPAGQPAAAAPVADDYVWCKSCGINLATVRRVPVRHVCRCVWCRIISSSGSGSGSPDPRPCSFCNGTLR